MATASKAITLRYIQPGMEGKSGLTPIIDNGKWIYKRDPGETLQNATIARFTDIEDYAVTAKDLAVTAKEIADSKPSLDTIKGLDLADFKNTKSNFATQSWVSGKGYITSAEVTTNLQSHLQKNGYVMFDSKNRQLFYQDCSNNTCTKSVIATFTTSGTISSDERLKDITAPLDIDLGEIAALRTVRFNWKSDGREDIGLIAQDVERIMPELTETFADGTLGLDYGRMAALVAVHLVREVRELKEELRKHKNQ